MPEASSTGAEASLKPVAGQKRSSSSVASTQSHQQTPAALTATVQVIAGVNIRAAGVTYLVFIGGYFASFGNGS